MENDDPKAGNRSWQPRLNPESRRKSLGIVDALIEDLHLGLIRAGDRLPTQRTIAGSLGIDLTTVTKAFNEAHRRGLITATIGRGTFIAPQAEAALEIRRAPERHADLSMNSPPQPETAALARRIPEAMARVLSGRNGGALLAYQDSGGTPADRMAGAKWLAPRLGPVDAARITIAAGAQNALFAICAGIATKGDIIAAPQWTYPGLQTVAAQLGLRLHTLEMDEDGILPEALEALCTTARPRALYIVPTIDNPTTATLPPERRGRIADIARQFGIRIIEDDPYGMLPEQPPAPVATHAPELTYHIATLSKCVSPAMRIAYIAAPDPASANRLNTAIRATSLMAPPLTAAIATSWIDTGMIDTITAAIRDENGARQAIAATALQGRSYRHHPHGHHLWLTLPNGWRAMEFADRAERSGLSVVPASAFSLTPSAIEAVRISLGPPSDQAVLKRALDLLNLLLDATPAPGRTIV